VPRPWPWPPRFAPIVSFMIQDGAACGFVGTSRSVAGLTRVHLDGSGLTRGGVYGIWMDRWSDDSLTSLST